MWELKRESVVRKRACTPDKNVFVGTNADGLSQASIRMELWLKPQARPELSEPLTEVANLTKYGENASRHVASDAQKSNNCSLCYCTLANSCAPSALVLKKSTKCK